MADVAWIRCVVAVFNTHEASDPFEDISLALQKSCCFFKKSILCRHKNHILEPESSKVVQILHIYFC